MSGSVKQQMEVFLGSLDYDFEQFTLAGFTRWLERRRGRPIVFVEWELPPDVPGIWVRVKRQLEMAAMTNTGS